jgi:hypothetical protein
MMNPRNANISCPAWKTASRITSKGISVSCIQQLRKKSGHASQAAGKARHRRGAMPAFPAHLCSSTTTEISSMANILRVAACHASPVFLNARKTTEKAISFIKQAASRKANLVVFPETYFSAFPIWNALRPPTENHSLFQHMVQESIYADGAEIEAIREAARSSGMLISIGFSERSRHSNGCLYNSMSQ